MNEVVSFRFRPHELRHIQTLSTAESVDRTTAAKELIEYGWKYYVLKQYKDGRLSLERAAKELHISIGDMIDLLSDLGVPSPIRYEDYLEGLKVLR